MEEKVKEGGTARAWKEIFISGSATPPLLGLE